jgi:hypothetical protein
MVPEVAPMTITTAVLARDKSKAGRILDYPSAGTFDDRRVRGRSCDRLLRGGQIRLMDAILDVA